MSKSIKELKKDLRFYHSLAEVFYTPSLLDNKPVYIKFVEGADNTLSVSTQALTQLILLEEAGINADSYLSLIKKELIIYPEDEEKKKTYQVIKVERKLNTLTFELRERK